MGREREQIVLFRRMKIEDKEEKRMEFDLADPLTSLNGHQPCTFSELFAFESEHLPLSNHLCLSNTRDFSFSFRCEAISLILQVKFTCKLDPFIVYLAISYMDRFLSKQEIPGKPWVLKLLLISCLSLASKMKDAPFSISDLQKEDFIFEAQSINKMELLILDALKWRMRSITPFCFLHFFLSLSDLKDLPFQQALKHRASEIIFNAHTDIKFLEFKPSTVAASAVMTACYELFPPIFSSMRSAISSCRYVDEGVMLKCFNLMQEMVEMEGYESMCNRSFPLADTPGSVLDWQHTGIEDENTLITTQEKQRNQKREAPKGKN
ncbi:Cyclin [Quillaja saponaria]|uniref:B-like cyclin n=1 Tax=Quillaja saponaria TaxID=32244 RepID=A0AAD7PUJ3_QUISA|nr:Cyclin [Quillaja saponaria]